MQCDIEWYNKLQYDRYSSASYQEFIIVCKKYDNYLMIYLISANNFTTFPRAVVLPTLIVKCLKLCRVKIFVPALYLAMDSSFFIISQYYLYFFLLERADERPCIESHTQRQIRLCQAFSRDWCEHPVVLFWTWQFLFRGNLFLCASYKHSIQGIAYHFMVNSNILYTIQVRLRWITW